MSNETETVEDLKLVIEELHSDLEEAEAQIKELERENVTLSRLSKGGNASEDALSFAALEAENDEIRGKLALLQQELLKCKEDLTDKTAQLKVVTSDKLEAEADNRKYRKKVEDLERAVTEAEEASRSNMRKSQETSKLKANSQKDQLKLLAENEDLQKENAKLLEKVKGHQTFKAEMEKQMSELEIEKEQLELVVHNLDVSKEELEIACMELEKELENVKEKLQDSQVAENQWEVEVQHMEQENYERSVKMEAELSRCNKIIAELEQEAVFLKDSTQVGEKQREIDILSKKLKDNYAYCDNLKLELESARSEKIQLAERLIEYDDKSEEVFYDKLSIEKEKARTLQKKVESLVEKLKDEESQKSSIEKENKLLQDEVDSLSAWKVIYEKNHGLQELAKHQKKMKEDGRRLLYSLEQMSHQLNETIDAKELMEQSFQKLKLETGRDPNFQYPEYVLEEEMKGECAKLRAQVVELEGQIAGLEEDTVKLRLTLKNQAGVFGEGGFKYAGMSTEMLLKVNEFASNLRDGIVKLPMDDRSAQLLVENKRLKEDIKNMNAKVEMYEQELTLGLGNKKLSDGPSSSNPSSFIQQQFSELQSSRSKELESEFHAVREDLSRILRENGELKSRLMHMQEEITLLLRQQIGKAEGSTDDFAAMLLASNETLMRELQEIRTVSSRIPSMPSQHSAPTSDRSDAVQSPAKASIKSVVHSKNKLPPSGRRGGADNSTAAPVEAQQQGTQPRILPATPQHPVGYFQNGPNYSQQMFMPSPAAFSVNAQSPGFAMGTPSTPHGKTLLSKTIANMNLPPEDWAEELKELNGQLIECIEQLFDREQELEQQRSVVESLEEYLVQVKQQLASVYFDYSQKASEWESKEKAIKNESTTLLHERDDLRLKLKRITESMEPLNPEDADSKYKECSRKLAVYEVNEAILARKFQALTEQLKEEQTLRQRVEEDFVEMEGSLKRRILFLEEYKSTTGPKLLQLHSQIDSMIPQEDYLIVQNELESLRQDHLYALRRELESRVNLLDIQEKSRHIRKLKIDLISKDSELTEIKTSWHNITMEVEHQKQATQKALSSVTSIPAQTTKEFTSLVSEMARFRGDASRLEAELVASKYRCELLEVQLHEQSFEMETLNAKYVDLEGRYNSAEFAERSSRKEIIDLKLKFEGGLNKEAADQLRNDLKLKEEKLEEVIRNARNLSEMAEIATQQAESLSGFRDAYLDEIKALRDHTSMLESRTDDDLIIGRLQRHLMATKTAYKAFVRKYQHLRSTMRQREIVMRVLEHRLDQRENAALKTQEANRIEISALSKALQSIYDMPVSSNEATATVMSQKDGGKEKLSVSVPKRKSALKLTVGQKLEALSNQIVNLATAAEKSNKLAEESDNKCRNFDNECQDLREDNKLLRRTIRDMTDVLESAGLAIPGTASSGLGSNAVTSLKKQQQHSKAVASRLLALSDEVRNLKMNNLQQKREISVLQQDKKHLKNVLARVEDDLRGFEEGRTVEEGKTLLGIEAPNADNEEDSAIIAFMEMNKELLQVNDMKSIDITESVDNFKPPFDFSRTSLTAEELMVKLENTTNDMLGYKRELSTQKRQIESAHSKVIEQQRELDEKNQIIAKYELRSELQGGPTIERNESSGRIPRGKELWLIREEQEKLQEAASATIGSMRAMLEEKNREIDRQRAKIDSLQNGDEGRFSTKRMQSLADRRAEALLKRLEEEDKYNKHGQREDAPPENMEKGLVSRLMEQMERADEIVADRERTVLQLEQKLAAQSNKCERAELRCASALKEMEDMKSDLITLSQQLQQSEARYIELAKQPRGAPPEATEIKSVDIVDPSNNRELKRKIAELQKAVTVKDDKIKSYRGIIVRLKEEFIKSEEERAVSEVHQKSKASQSGPSHAASDEDLEALRLQVGALRDGLRKAKEDLDTARKGRETLVKARQSALEESEKLELQIGRAEAQASAAQEALQRCRRDLEESRKREVKLREKLKDYAEGQDGAAGHAESDRATSDLKNIIDRLQKESELLRSQNIALRRALANQGADIGRIVADELQGRNGTDEEDGEGHEEAKHSDRERRPISAPRPGGNRLGTAESSAVNVESGVGDIRQQQHLKWENEKKLQKRITTVEKRLQDKIQECDDAQAELRRLRELNQHQTSVLQKERDKVEKTKQTLLHHQQLSERHVSPDDVAKLEELHQRLFGLEEENEQLRRRALVQLPNEIAASRRKTEILAQQVAALEEQIEESEMRQKRRGSGANNLKESEDRYLRDERLKDDLNAAKRLKLELESTILERDSTIMELRFDIEAKSSENERLRRRIREVEASSHLAHGSGNDHDNKQERMVGGRFVKDRDAEGVIEAMRKVVDKLKVENERLRKGSSSSDNRIGEYEKRLSSEKKKCEKLEQEINALKEKVQSQEDGGQKLVQRQQQIATLRKQLKDKEDLIVNHTERMNVVIQENESMKKRVTDSMARIQQLEMQLASLRSVSSQGRNGTGNEQSREAAELRQVNAIQVQEIEKLKVDLRNAVSNKPNAISSGFNDNVSALRDQLDKLSAENARLKNELSAFDMEFFEEIENLKYAHAEAVRKLRQYEQRAR